VALARGPVIQMQDIPEAVVLGEGRPLQSSRQTEADPAPDAVPGGTLWESRERVEIQRIHAALQKHGNNRLRAAAELGISRMGLYKKLRKYGFCDSETTTG